jgi:uncharacterized coiled-coil protein SlyX
MNENQSQLDRIEAKLDLLLSIMESLDSQEQEDNDLMYKERDQTQPL